MPKLQDESKAQKTGKTAPMADVLKDAQEDYIRDISIQSPRKVGRSVVAAFTRARTEFLSDRSQNNFGESNSPGYNGTMAEFEDHIEATAEQLGVPASAREKFKASVVEIARFFAALDNCGLTLPKSAPKLFAERPEGQSIVDFLSDPDGWGPYVKARLLTRPDLRQLDPDAYRAVAKWVQRHGQLPDDVYLLTKTEVVNRRAGFIPKDLAKEATREAARQGMREYRQRMARPDK